MKLTNLHSWVNQLEFFSSKRFEYVLKQLHFEEQCGYTIFPPRELIFNAFCQTPYDDVKAVILGQDPYHQPGQAHGLSFSVPEDVTTPPSLKNIFKEIDQDLYEAQGYNGLNDLHRWAQQGVLLVNATLTVRASEPGSHKDIGWHYLIDEVLSKLSYNKGNVVFFLWGKFAKSKEPLIESSSNLVLTSPHPSPFSAYRGFFGSRHFSQCNAYLEKVGKEKIQW